MAEKEINITYETLFELLRREKTRDELQKLDATFFSDVVKYVKDKEEFLEHQRKKQDLFAVEEMDKAKRQIDNIKKILKEFYEKREKKMIEMALDASKTNSVVIDTSSMLDEEKLFYEKVLNTLNKFRKGLLSNVQRGIMPHVQEDQIVKPAEQTEKETIPDINKEVAQNAQPLSAPSAAETKTVMPAAETASLMQNSQKPFKFVHAVPRFVGPDLKEYGPFEEGDVAELPPEIAEALINKGRVE